MVKLVDFRQVVSKAVTPNVHFNADERLGLKMWELMYPSPITYIYNDTRDIANKNNWRKVSNSGRKLFITGLGGRNAKERKNLES